MRHVMSCLTIVCVPALVSLTVSNEASAMGRAGGASTRSGGFRLAAPTVGRFGAGRFAPQGGVRGAFVDRGYRPWNGRLPDMDFPRFGDPSRFQQAYGRRGCGRGSARCYDTAGLYGSGPGYGSYEAGYRGYGPGRPAFGDYGAPVVPGIAPSPVQPPAIYVISGNARATTSGRRNGAAGPVSATSDGAGQDSVVVSAASRTTRVLR